MKLLRKHVGWFITRTARDRLDSCSAHAAYFLIISFLPFIALLLTLMQHIHFAPGLTLIEAALEFLPGAVADYVAGLLPTAIQSHGILPVALVMAVWSSSAGMVAIIKGLDSIFEVKKARNIVHMRLVAAVYVVLFAMVLLLVAVLLVFGSTIYNFLLQKSPRFFATLLMNFKSLLGFILLLAFFTLMYTFLPRRRVRFLHNLAGAAFSAAGWVLFSYFFSLFVENFSDFSIYGGLATLVILMFWLFFCMYILFLGAEVSMWLESSGIGGDLKEQREARRERRSAKKRKAHKAAKGKE